jgi:hypothetical protein
MKRLLVKSRSFRNHRQGHFLCQRREQDWRRKPTIAGAKSAQLVREGEDKYQKRGLEEFVARGGMFVSLRSAHVLGKGVVIIDTVSHYSNCLLCSFYYNSFFLSFSQLTKPMSRDIVLSHRRFTPAEVSCCLCIAVLCSVCKLLSTHNVIAIGS